MTMNSVRTFIAGRKYEILLISFLLLIFGNSFYVDSKPVGGLFIMQNMLTGFLVFYGNRYLRIVLGILNLAHLLLATIAAPYAFVGNFAVKHIVYLLYFWIVSIEIYRKIFSARSVSKEMISAVLCGFILLCLTGTFLFLQIELLHPHSFSHLQGGAKNRDDLSYFSFVTVLTIGYGDIVPLTMIARRAVMLIGLAGHFYTVFVTAIVIGKFINNHRESEKAKLRQIVRSPNGNKVV
jgi:voltage-gated potassium channel